MIRRPGLLQLVSEAEQLVDDQKEHAWMALYANDRDVLETLLYRRLQTLWHDCTDALAVFTKHRAGPEGIVGTRFSIGLQMQPGKSSRTTGQLSGPIFPATFVVRWKNAFPQEPLVVGSRTRRV